MFEGNASYLYVANVASGVADAGDVKLIANGSVAFCKEDGTIEKGANTTEKLRLAKKLADGTMIYSPELNMATRKNVVGKSFVAPERQISYLGFNGTSGALDATANELFVMHLEWMNSQFTINNTPIRFSAPYQTTAASQKELAFGLVSAINPVIQRQPFKFVAVEVVGDGTVAAITGNSTITKVTKGVKGVGSYIKTGDATATFTASTSSVTDATVLNIPSSGGRTFSYTQTLLGSGAGSACTYIGETAYLIADAGTAVQNATAMVAAINAGTQATASNVAGTSAVVTIVYNTDFYSLPPLAMETVDDATWTNVVVTTLTGDAIPVKYSISGTTSAAATFVLSEAYAGETGYVFDGTTAAGMTGIATVTNYGLKFSGKDNSKFNPVNDTWEPVRFKILSGDFVTATVTYTTNATPGTGYAKQLANLESYAQFLNKSGVIGAYPEIKRTQEVDLTKDYDIISFEFADQTYVSPTTGLGPIHTFRIQVAVEVSLAGDDIDTVLAVTV